MFINSQAIREQDLPLYSDLISIFCDLQLGTCLVMTRYLHVPSRSRIILVIGQIWGLLAR